MRRETCKTCGAAIIWLPNNNSGKKAPVDADPVKFGGNIVIEDNGAGGHHYRILKKGEPTRQGSRHQSHFSTCGQAAGHRIGGLLVELDLHLERLGNLTVGVPGRLDASVRQHEEIVTAITKRDPGAAEAACREHIRSVFADLINALPEQLTRTPTA